MQQIENNTWWKEIHHDLALFDMIHLRKEAGRFLDKTLSLSCKLWASSSKNILLFSFYLTAVSHHGWYLDQNLHVNTSSAACLLHGNPWKLDQQPSELGSDQNSTLRLGPVSDRFYWHLRSKASLRKSSSLSTLDPFDSYRMCRAARRNLTGQVTMSSWHSIFKPAVEPPCPALQLSPPIRTYLVAAIIGVALEASTSNWLLIVCWWHSVHAGNTCQVLWNTPKAVLFSYEPEWLWCHHLALIRGGCLKMWCSTS